MTRLTNDEFGARVGCDFTTASKLRSGDRLPSLDLLARIRKAFDLDGNEALDAYSSGREAFAAYLRSKVFEPTEDPEGPSQTVSGDDT